MKVNLISLLVIASVISRPVFANDKATLEHPADEQGSSYVKPVCPLRASVWSPLVVGVITGVAGTLATQAIIKTLQKR